MIRKSMIVIRPFARILYTDTSSHLAPFRAKPVEKKTASTATLKSKAIATGASPVKVPGSHFFAQLKLEEHNQSIRRRRKRFDYKKNYSAALALPFSKIESAKTQDEHSAFLELSKKHIIEHANRRVDLFFYTLIAYYRTTIFPTSGHTDFQHGKGRNIKGDGNITEACHSSLTPSLIDITIYKKRRGGEKHKSLLCGTHFMDSLNSTVELPPCVNHLDELLENNCRQKCLEILRDVSLGTKNPIEGLTIFLKMMQDILKSLKRQAERKNHSALVQHSLVGARYVSPRLIDLVINGTLSTTFSYHTQTAADDYIQLLLRMTPEERAVCEHNAKNKEKLCLEKIIAMQKEVLETKSSFYNGQQS